MRMKSVLLLLACALSAWAQQWPPPIGGGSIIPSVTNLISGNGSGNGSDSGIAPSIVVRKYFGTAAPGSVTGNLPGDLFSDTTHHNDYFCGATSGTAAPACTSVTAGGWTLLNGAAGSLGIQVAGSAIAAEPNLNLIPGTGINQVCVDNPGSSRVDCTPTLDSTVGLTHAAYQAGNDVLCKPSGGVAAYVCAPTVALAVITPGMHVLMYPDVTASSNASATISGLATISIKQKDGSTDPNGTLVGNQPQWMVYNGVTTCTSSCSGVFILLGGGSAVAAIHQYGASFGTPGGVALTAGMVQYFDMPQGCSIIGGIYEADAGTFTVKFWKVADGTAIPTVANVINTAGVGLATGTRLKSFTTSDFTTTTVSAYEAGAVTITAVSGAGYVNAKMLCQ